MLKEFVPKFVSCLKEGYSFAFFKKDLFAGVTVGIVALPLALAFAIASGVGPEKGLYTAIIAGFFTSLLGGSRVQIAGPAGAFVVVIYDIVLRQGYEGLVVATVVAAVILVLLGCARLGVWIHNIPSYLVSGITTGIAVLVFSSQIKSLLGLQMGVVPTHFIEKWQAYFSAFPTIDGLTAVVGCSTFGIILLIRSYFPSLPWAITAIALATLATWGLGLPIATIATSFGDLPRVLPFPSLPDFSLFHWDLRSLGDGINIALLVAIESLLCAVVADRLIGTRHRSNCELVAQGMANLASVLFGGIPASGTIARTTTNIHAGAKTPVAGMIHALTLFLIIFCFGPIVSLIPLTALAAVLVMVAWNISELKHFGEQLKRPAGDVAVFLSVLLLTVFIDLIVAVEVGIALAVLVFLKRKYWKKALFTK